MNGRGRCSHCIRFMNGRQRWMSTHFYTLFRYEVTLTPNWMKGNETLFKSEVRFLAMVGDNDVQKNDELGPIWFWMEMFVRLLCVESRQFWRDGMRRVGRWFSFFKQSCYTCYACFRTFWSFSHMHNSVAELISPWKLYEKFIKTDEVQNKKYPEAGFATEHLP